eukprot:Nk52_evm39s1671 gene=Nk52_evmTU39s1671
MKPVEFAAFISLGGIWGSSFLFIKWGSAVFPPASLVAMRLILASVLMWAFIGIKSCFSSDFRGVVKNQLSSGYRFYICCMTMGLLNNAIPFTLVAWAESRPSVNAGVASVLDSTIPIFGQIFAHFILHTERMTWNRVVGIFVGFAGVIAVCSEKVFNVRGESESSPTDIIYYMMVVGASASYGLASVFGKKMTGGFCPILTATGQITSGMIITMTVSLLWEYNNPVSPFPTHYDFLYTHDIKAWACIVYLGVIATCVAYALYFYLLRTVGSVKQTMVGFLLPVFGVFEGVVFNGEWKTANALAMFLEVLGAFLVILSIYFVNYIGQKSGPEEERRPLLVEKDCERSPAGGIGDSNVKEIHV